MIQIPRLQVASHCANALPVICLHRLLITYADLCETLLVTYSYMATEYKPFDRWSRGMRILRRRGLSFLSLLLSGLNIFSIFSLILFHSNYLFIPLLLFLTLSNWSTLFL